jgi:hypothetical protein
MKTISTDHPWQVTPAQLIAYGKEHLDNKDEFSKKIALLLVDVGVEALFKVYLLLGDKVTGAKLKFSKRKSAAEGNFHDLVQGVKKSIPHEINESIFDRVQYFHTIRNKIYHQGDGVVPAEVNVKEYADIAVHLLGLLLEVELDPDDSLDDNDQFAINSDKFSVNNKRFSLVEKYNDLLFDLTAATAIIRPELVMRSNINQIKELKHTYPDRDHGDLQKRALLEKKRINGLSDLTGIPFSDSYLVKQILKDIHLLYLVVVLDYTDKDRYENLKLYQEASYFSQKEHTDIMNMDPHEYQEWKEKHEDKLNRTIGKFNDWIQEMQITIEDLILKQVY